MAHVNAGHELEKLSRKMRRRPDTSGRKVKLARVGLGVSDQFGNGLDRDRWIDLEHVGNAEEACNGGEVANEIEIEITVERRVDRVRRCSHQERIAIGGRSRDHLGADIATGARAIVEDKWLTQSL